MAGVEVGGFVRYVGQVWTVYSVEYGDFKPRAVLGRYEYRVSLGGGSSAIGLMEVAELRDVVPCDVRGEPLG